MVPKLADVAGVRIVVWLNEHHPVPHIQTVGEHEFSLAIEDGRLLTPGRADPRVLRKVRDWLEANRPMAMAAWDASRRGELFDPRRWR
jgi:hypothetical protein